MLKQLTLKTLSSTLLCTSVFLTVAVSQTQLAVASDTSYAESSKTAEELRLEYLEELAKEYNKLYFENFATDPDDIPISEYEGGTDRYLGDLVIKGDKLILEVSSGELLVVTKNERQEQLKQQLIRFVSEHKGVPIRVGIQGVINIKGNSVSDDLDEVVLVNYNNLEANATHSLSKILSAIDDEE